MCADAQLDSRMRGAVPTTAMFWSDRMTQTPHHWNQTPSCWLSYREGRSIRTFTCPIPCPKGTTNLSRGWWDPHHVWYGCPSLATDSPHSFRFPYFPSHYGMVGLKALDPQIGNIFLPFKFLGGTYEHCHRT